MKKLILPLPFKTDEAYQKAKREVTLSIEKMLGGRRLNYEEICTEIEKIPLNLTVEFRNGVQVPYRAIVSMAASRLKGNSNELYDYYVLEIKPYVSK